ncbi:unnamed protein product [Lampetra fluviatilis]
MSPRAPLCAVSASHAMRRRPPSTLRRSEKTPLTVAQSRGGMGIDWGRSGGGGVEGREVRGAEYEVVEGGCRWRYRVPLAQVEAAAAPSPRMRQRARRGARSSTDSHHASSGAARRSGEDVGGEMREHDRPKSIAFLLASLRSPAMGWDARERTSGCDPVTRGGG